MQWIERISISMVYSPILKKILSSEMLSPEMRSSALKNRVVAATLFILTLYLKSICCEVGAFSFQYYQVVISIYLNPNKLHLGQGNYSKYLNARLSLDT